MKKHEKLRIKKERAEQTAVKKIEDLLGKPMSAEKRLNRPQYIGLQTVGYISNPYVAPIFCTSVIVLSSLLTDTTLGSVGLCVLTFAPLHVVSKFLPRLTTRTQAVKTLSPCWTLFPTAPTLLLNNV